MNKSELIDAVQAGIGGEATNASAEKALSAVLEAIAAGVRKDGVVQIIGFGSFKKSERKARMGRNPKTGEPMQIGASTSIRFSPSKKLKDTL